MAGHPEKGKALDIGCGAGTFSVYLAKQGFDVTGVDFVEKALGFARERARREGAKVSFVKSDILQWNPPGKFDLIFDSGCLHSLEDSSNTAYKEKLLKWLAPGGDYVLVHFGRRGFLDWLRWGRVAIRVSESLSFSSRSSSRRISSRGWRSSSSHRSEYSD